MTEEPQRTCFFHDHPGGGASGAEGMPAAPLEVSASERRISAAVQASLKMLHDYCIAHPESSDSARELGYQIGKEMESAGSGPEGVTDPLLEKPSRCVRFEFAGTPGGDGSVRTVRVRCAKAWIIRGLDHDVTPCSYMEGLLGGVLEDVLGRRVDVREVSCESARSGCVFKILD